MDKLIAQLLDNGIFLSVEQDRLKVKHNSDLMSDELLQQIKANKFELIAYLSAKDAYADYQDIMPIKRKGPFKLSSAQRRMWILSQFEASSVAYNLPESTYLNQDIEVENFKRAIDATIDRHEILRTVFREEESGEVRQWVLEREDLGFSIHSLDFREEDNKKDKVQAYIAADSHQTFDLIKGPLFRAALLQVEDEEYVFYFNMHHIISDDWSMEVLTKDVLKYYEAYQTGREPDLKELRIHYKDYCDWQLARLNEDSFDVHKIYWLDKFSGELPLLDLPGAKQRPHVKTYNGHGLVTYVDKETTDKLKEYTREKGSSLFMSLLASWNVLIYRYTGEKDIIIGTAVAGRVHANLEDQIGFYVNTLALRNEVNPEESFDSFYESLKEQTLKSYSHQMYPFDRLVEGLGLQRDMGRNPVFDISITYHNTTEIKGIEGLNNDVINQVSDNGFSKVKNDIELHFKEVGDYIHFKLIYNVDIYEREMIERLMIHFKRILNSLLSHPEQKISHIDYLSEKEKCELLVTFNDTAVAYPKDKTIVDLFEEQVERTPDNIAVVFGEKQQTYRELNEKSNQLAHYLRDNYDIQPDNLIGIQLDRSEWMIISILGVLKAGGAYVPIDPEYPSSRKEYIVKDTGLKLLITEASFIYDIDYYEGEVFAIDVEFDSENYGSEALSKFYTPGNLAYVIYTSGSTGKPKGVMVEHRSAVNLYWWYITSHEIDTNTRSLIVIPLGFDAASKNILAPLFRGGMLVMAPTGVFIPEVILSEILLKKVTLLNCVPSVFNSLLNSNNDSVNMLRSLKNLALGGEPLDIKPITRLFTEGSKCIVTNVYGPTEATDISISYIVSKADTRNSNIPIGKPINNVSVYVLDVNMQPVAIGVTGELYIGGVALARGYLNNTNLTQERFIVNPFATETDKSKGFTRLYKTGDLGRWLPDGNIEFIGRKDDQVKIRGHRIELGEIEYALSNHEEIKQGVVLARENESGEKELVAYIVSNVEQNASDLRAYLKQTLPEYMLPAHFVQLEAIPLTANSKIDKKALPDPGIAGLSSGVEYAAPGTEQEEVLVSVWSEVLKKEGISIKDSFYNLGGDSIKSIQVVARLKQLGYRLKVEHLLRTPILEELARLIELTTQVSDQSEVSGAVVLTPIQEWFFKSEEIKVHEYFNQSVLLYSKEELDSSILEKSIEDLTRHHDALRMVYKQ
uniref:non-ribosomal peptide synthetase n=1 Tax=Flavobacterium sp. UGB4466 TaxID=2730889 RepID=UPI00192B203F